ncbi:DegT/DnrJ/EryC1/StrS aminotransferase family protein [Bacteriovorax sp. BSW11_IV]|uniref:DegT/DnrJ/EryC1/StrS family aminotransferase n=1 Tax=Bacteriovorax sp. BSW11_IV TaxID=1353529 RepID=UPI00038A1CB1|nr:DegT/DnrJ/EryC1/StrS family aminotransferase [Bacteriovorax sp. BSW11_IV]EQC45940.1 DegT/DnrJ/EryC1/StrS aminotransferase family protein [Bacteriovorax sp. BSW11_IV]
MIKMDRKLYLSCPHVTGNEIKYVTEAIESNWVAPLGPYVNKFEEDLRTEIKDGGYVVALNSGTGAIDIALDLIGVQSGDIIFCSSFTFIGSANPILYKKAVPVFIDADPETWCICEKSLEKALIKYEKIGKRPKALICVDLFGNSPNYNKIQEICTKYDVKIIEDSAEALGSSFNGKACGTFGDYGIFSFNGNKIITTSGGGALVTKTKELAQRAQFLITQARDNAPYYEHSVMGYNYRMSNICAAIGVAQLETLRNKIELKKAIHERYQEAFKGSDRYKMLNVSAGTDSNYWLSCLTIKNVSFEKTVALVKALNESNIEARQVWKPMHLQPLFKDADYICDQEDVCSKLFESSICLPSACDMTLEEQITVINNIKGFIES